MKSILCPITLEQIDLNSAMISNALRPPRSTVSVRASAPTDDAIYSNAVRAGVFPKCGHVFELPQPHINARLVACPKCRVPGLMVPLVLQTAHTFMHKNDEYTHVLPCGHAVGEELGKRMAGVALPSNEMLIDNPEVEMWWRCLTGGNRRCWFCGWGFKSEDLRKLYFEARTDGSV